MHSPSLDNETKVFITGNLPTLGNWNPSKVPMKPMGDHRWSFEIRCKPDYPIEYKYTLGSWKKEGANADGRPLQNFVVQSKIDKVVKDQIAFWTKGDAQPVQGQITGTVKYHRQIKGSGVLPRDIIVWLPPDYEKKADRYPVLYMHDGQNIVDPKTSSFGVDWQVDEICTKLIKSKKINPLIVVGIYNTPARVKEYLPGKTGRAYEQFVVGVVKPLIDKNYRTKKDRNNSAVAGSSAGGICAFRMAWDYPDIFSKAICMSPSFKYTRPDGTKSVDYGQSFGNSQRPVPTPYFYLDNGGIGLEKLLQPGIDEMLFAMKDKGMVAGEDYMWKLFPDSTLR